MYKNQKILIKSEKHCNEVVSYLESVGYKTKYGDVIFLHNNINFIVTYNKGYYHSLSTKEEFDKDSYKEVELVTTLEGDVVCTYLKEVTPSLKKWKFEVRPCYSGCLGLCAVDIDSDKTIACLIDLDNMLSCKYAKDALDMGFDMGYDISGYEWNGDGSIKIN